MMKRRGKFVLRVKKSELGGNPDLSLLISASGVAAGPVFLQTDYFCSAINVP